MRTGTYTMLYMAGSLSFTAGGVILLYLLWNVQPIAHQTLNAVTFTPSLPVGNSTRPSVTVCWRWCYC